MKQKKKLNIVNYTSNVPVERTVAALEGLLVLAGAERIAKFYANGELDGFVFVMPTPSGPKTIKLPSNTAGVTNYMLKQVKKKHRGTVERVTQQAHRTAWRLLYDELAIQLSMIIIGQVDAMEVFMAYLYDGKTNETFYERLQRQEFQFQLGSGE